MTKVICRDVDESGRSHHFDMRSRVEELKSQLETPALAPATTPQPKSSVTAGDMEVRMDKVAGIRAALAAGTYKVPAVAVASRVVDRMRSVKRPG
jgi:hypothetical protein